MDTHFVLSLSLDHLTPLQRWELIELKERREKLLKTIDQHKCELKRGKGKDKNRFVPWRGSVEEKARTVIVLQRLKTIFHFEQRKIIEFVYNKAYPFSGARSAVDWFCDPTKNFVCDAISRKCFTVFNRKTSEHISFPHNAYCRNPREACGFMVGIKRTTVLKFFDEHCPKENFLSLQNPVISLIGDDLKPFDEDIIPVEFLMARAWDYRPKSKAGVPRNGFTRGADGSFRLLLARIPYDWLLSKWVAQNPNAQGWGFPNWHCAFRPVGDLDFEPDTIEVLREIYDYGRKGGFFD